MFTTVKPSGKMLRTIDPGVPDEAVALITESLLKRNVTSFTIRPGSNGAVWVSHGRCDCYYIIRDGKIKDVIYD